MKNFIYLFLLFVSIGSNAQNVTKERLVGFSYYTNGSRSDSASFTYPDRYTTNGYSDAQVQSVEEYKEVGFKERYSYDLENKIRSKTIFIKNKKEVDKQIYSHDKKLISSDKIIFLSGTEKLTHRIWRTDYDRDEELEDYYVKITNYNSEERPIYDSSIIYHPNNTFDINTAHFSYPNKNVLKTISYNNNWEDSLMNKVSIDSNSNGTHYIETYNVLIDNTITNNRKRIKSNINGIRLNIQFLKVNGLWDTISYTETKYLEIRDGMNLLEQKTLIRNSPTDTFRNTYKISKEYNKYGLYTLQRTFNVDSIGNWKLETTSIPTYNNLNQLIFSKTIYEENNRYSTTQTTYTSKGSLASLKQSNVYPNLITSTTNNYYYEPYLKEETQLNYNQLVPITYPNPFKSDINILFSCIPNKAGTITITNTEGKIIEKHNFSSPTEIYQYTWNANHLPAGIYIARITMGKETENIQLQKQ